MANTTNPVDFTSLTPPVVGATWSTSIALPAGALISVLVVGAGVPAAPAPNPVGPGDLLIPLIPFPCFFAGTGTHDLPIAPNVTFIGRAVRTQGFRLEANGDFAALNALDLVLGTGC